jgi:hypothetical protein
VTNCLPTKVDRWQENKLLDGFLAGREQLREEVKKEDVQTGLFE